LKNAFEKKGKEGRKKKEKKDEEIPKRSTKSAWCSRSIKGY